MRKIVVVVAVLVSGVVALPLLVLLLLLREGGANCEETTRGEGAGGLRAARVRVEGRE